MSLLGVSEAALARYLDMLSKRDGERLGRRAETSGLAVS